MKNLMRLMVLVLASGLSIGQASEISPYLEVSTAVVAKVDLDLLDVPRTLAAINQVAQGLIPEQVQGQVKTARGGLEPCCAAAECSGFTSRYRLWRYLTFVRNVLVPTAQPDSAIQALQAILAILPQDLGYELTKVDDGLLIATTEVLQRLRR